MEKPGYKEIQNMFKEIAKKSIQDKEFRKLCLKDSKEAMKVVNCKVAISKNIIFLEEDGEGFDSDCIVCVLPPFLKPSWLLSKELKE